ncbi:MAG: hypothetical protein WKF40_06585 [Thermoleophilaceae bacterium]
MAAISPLRRGEKSARGSRISIVPTYGDAFRPSSPAASIPHPRATLGYPNADDAPQADPRYVAAGPARGGRFRRRGAGHLGRGDKLTVYTARSHYGEEKPFKQFASSEGADLTLFGGDASSLYERLKNEGAGTRADVLITVDAANLWRAEQAGLLAA